MKRLYILGLFALGTSPVFSAVGTHNFVIKAGAGLSSSLERPVRYFNGQKVSDEEMKLKDSYFGGAIALDLGYQFFGIKNSVVHGVDALVGFGMNFEHATKLAGERVNPFLTVKLNRPYGYISSTYAIGHQFNNAKLMFDILGINLSIGSATSEFLARVGIISSATKIAGGGIFSFGLNLPLGTRYVMNNGFVAGFKHSLNFLFPAYDVNDVNILSTKIDNKSIRSRNRINYDLIVSLGYMFGK